mgnify:CR=1 FL=1
MMVAVTLIALSAPSVGAWECWQGTQGYTCGTMPPRDGWGCDSRYHDCRGFDRRVGAVGVYGQNYGGPVVVRPPLEKTAPGLIDVPVGILNFAGRLLFGSYKVAGASDCAPNDVACNAREGGGQGRFDGQVESAQAARSGAYKQGRAATAPRESDDRH